MIVLLFPVELCAFCLLILYVHCRAIKAHQKYVQPATGRKEISMNRYSYSELFEAVKANETPDNVNALGEWFEQYGDRYWNGEFFDADGLRLFPVYVEVDEDQFEITGYEVR